MSNKTDQYEIDVADYISDNSNYKATRPDVDATYADLLIVGESAQSWVEVKMSHGDRLANYRSTFRNGEWSCVKSNRHEPVKQFIEEQLNASQDCADLLDKMRAYYNIPLDVIDGKKESDFAKAFRTAKTDLGLKNKNLVPPMKVKNVGSLIAEQYNFGKAAGCFYIQTGDDFFLLGDANPLGLPSDIPLFEGDGTFSARFSDRGQSQGTVWMEIIPDFRIDLTVSSKYSAKPGTNKLNPFK